MVSANVSGLPPGEHGFHIHEVGDCSDPQFETAGAHFNPGGQPHGDPAVEPHHAGDLGNLTAAEQGGASFSLRRTELTLDEGGLSILGRAVILHRDPDQFGVQPDGAAGPRIACGVIELAPIG
jgi:Cu-Zn family superoxide dismutase